MAQTKVNASDLVGLLEMASLLGVQKETTWRWRARQLLPAPVAMCSGTPIWTKEQILRWAQQTGRRGAPEGREGPTVTIVEDGEHAPTVIAAESFEQPVERAEAVAV